MEGLRPAGAQDRVLHSRGLQRPSGAPSPGPEAEGPLHCLDAASRPPREPKDGPPHIQLHHQTGTFYVYVCIHTLVGYVHMHVHQVLYIHTYTPNDVSAVYT